VTIYVCSLANSGENGDPPKELFTDDRLLADRFAESEDKRPGRGVYECINPLVPGARRRCLETVAALQFIYFDLDLVNIDATREQVIDRLHQLPVEFIWVRDSGSGNLHVGVEIKDPPLRDTPEYDRVVAVWKRLAEKLAADPAPVHPAALIRRVGTHNKKNGGNGLCHALWNGGTPLDVTELEELDELLVEPLLARKAKAAGGHDQAQSADGRKTPVDLDAELAAMSNGKSVNAVHIAIIPSLLRKAMHPDDVLTLVVNETMTRIGERLAWSRDAEVRIVIRRILSAYKNLLLKDYDPATGVIPDWLPGDFHARWIEALKQGRRPDVGYNASGFYVRSYGAKGTAETNDAGEKAKTEPTTDGDSPPHKKLRFRLVSFHDLRPGPEPLYLVDELIPVAGLVDVWGKAKCYKSFWCLDLMLHVTMGWEYRDRYVRQGAVVYCAFEGAHGYKKRIEALRRHYKITDGASVPLHVMPGQANLIAEHAVLIADITAQLGEVRPSAVVLDTLNKSLFGSENKDVDMGAYVRAAEAIRDAFGCVVIIIHHCGYDDTRPRGHSSLPGAVDAQLAVVRTEEVITVTVEMMRDGPEDIQVVSEVEVIPVGQDQNGKELTSLVVIPSDADAASRERKDWSRGLNIFHAALKHAIANLGETFQPEAGVLPVRAVGLWAVRDRFYATYAEAEENDTKRQNRLRQAFNRALAEAQKNNVIRIRHSAEQPMVWLPVRGEA
jgi:AAA domain